MVLRWGCQRTGFALGGADGASPPRHRQARASFEAAVAAGSYPNRDRLRRGDRHREQPGRVAGLDRRPLSAPAHGDLLSCRPGRVLATCHRAEASRQRRRALLLESCTAGCYGWMAPTIWIRHSSPSCCQNETNGPGFGLSSPPATIPTIIPKVVLSAGRRISAASPLV